MGKMKDSTLLKWTQNNKSNKLVGSKEKKEKKSKEDKKWLHRPENLTSGHIAYLVKFLGSTEVDQPKGIEVVKDGIRKLKFSQQLKKAEGAKTPKVELTVSVDGVTIQEPKSKKIQHQYPLNRISYCADDKAEKRFFSFIAKEADSEKHTCFVFVSDKLAEEITLTIGQAFDLAYKRFLSGKGAESETEKIARLERENTELRARLTEVGGLVGGQQLAEYLAKNNITELTVVSEQEPQEQGQEGEESKNSEENSETASSVDNSEDQGDKLINFDVPSNKLDTITLDDLNDDDFDPRAGDNTGDSSDGSDDFNPRSTILGSTTPTMKAPVVSLTPGRLLPPPGPAAPILAPPQVVPRDPAKVVAKPTNPFTSPTPQLNNDPFGMSSFAANANKTLPIGQQKQSLTVGKADFSLDDLDPLKI